MATVTGRLQRNPLAESASGQAHRQDSEVGRDDEVSQWTTTGGIPISFQAHSLGESRSGGGVRDLWLHLEHARLSLLRGFDELLCLEGLHGVEHLPHQIETVRRVLRQFRGRVLLADEVGLGKTIEACLLLREYLLRSLVKRVLILVPSPLVSQWHDELQGKFGLDFTVPPRTSAADQPEFWSGHERVLASLAFVKGKKRSALVAAQHWDLVIVDEPGHLKTEADFKKQFVTRGNPRDPRNRERLRMLLGEVMVRNTRSMVNLNLPARYAQTVIATPAAAEARLYERLDLFLRRRGSGLVPQDDVAATDEGSDEVQWTEPTPDVDAPSVATPRHRVHLGGSTASALLAISDATNPEESETTSRAEPTASSAEAVEPPGQAQWRGAATKGLSRMQLSHLLAAQGSHPAAVRGSLEKLALVDAEAAELLQLATGINISAKDERLLELIGQSHDHKTLVFVSFRRTLQHVSDLLTARGIAFSVFSGEQNDREKDDAVAALRDRVPVMLCTDSGGEGRNLQFADTLINYDLPWNPMKIEQRVGRVHRFGQTREVFVFNLCTAGSLEARLLRVLSEKIRMFELVVGEVSSILGNLDEADQFESLVFGLWLKSRDATDLDQSFESLGETLLDAQSKYLEAKELDDALFGEDYE